MRVNLALASGGGEEVLSLKLAKQFQEELWRFHSSSSLLLREGSEHLLWKMMNQIIQLFYLSIYILSIYLPRLEVPKSSFMKEHLCLSAVCNFTDKEDKGRT